MNIYTYATLTMLLSIASLNASQDLSASSSAKKTDDQYTAQEIRQLIEQGKAKARMQGSLLNEFAKKQQKIKEETSSLKDRAQAIATEHYQLENQGVATKDIKPQRLLDGYDSEDDRKEFTDKYAEIQKKRDALVAKKKAVQSVDLSKKTDREKAELLKEMEALKFLIKTQKLDLERNAIQTELLKRKKKDYADKIETFQAMDHMDREISNAAKRQNEVNEAKEQMKLYGKNETKQQRIEREALEKFYQ